MHSVTDRQTDGQQDDANSRSYCVAVRSAKNGIRTLRILEPCVCLCTRSGRLSGHHAGRRVVDSPTWRHRHSEM